MSGRVPHVDVVVIGGGVTGVLSAVRLAERGFSVHLLEKQFVGHGSSSRSNAGIRAQFGTPETVAGMLYAEWWYRHFHEILRTPTEREQPVMEQNGYLFLYDHPDAVGADRSSAAASAWASAQRLVAMQRAAGLAVEVLDPASVGARWPFLQAERLAGATWCAEDGFLHPHVIYGEGVRRARELGVSVSTRTEVLSARLRADRVASVMTSAGEWYADWFVNATNAWGPRVSAQLGGMSLPIRPVKRYLYHFQPDRVPTTVGLWNAQPMIIYGMGPGRGAHSRPDGSQLILAWAHDGESEPQFTDADQDRIDPTFNHEHGIDNFGFTVMAAVSEFAPELVEHGRIVATTSGFYAITPDANPLIGLDTHMSNLVHAAGFSGHGVMHAPVSAMLIEALIAGDVRENHVRLPAPFENRLLDMSVFAPTRLFSGAVESLVL